MKAAVKAAAAASKTAFEYSDRVRNLPPYLFLEIDRAKRAARERGVDIIDFGIGDPDMPTPDFVIQAFHKAVKDPATHKYPLDYGNPVFRAAVADWYRKRFGVALDPDKEILPLIGSKEGLTHMPLAFLNPGDKALVPDPAYPAYLRGVAFAGGISVPMPLRRKNAFLPDWDEIESQNLNRVKLMYLNYPNNPTGATADLDFFSRVVDFAKRRNILVCHDNAYSEIYEKKKCPSFLQVRGSKETGVEFHSLSKTFNMTGWRIGFVVGNAEAIAGLAKIKSNMDSGVFSAIQLAGAEALKRADVFTKRVNSIYNKRRAVLTAGLKSLGLNPFSTGATFYIWCDVPVGRGSASEFCQLLLEKAGVVATPGDGFGQNGKGCVRFTITVPEDRVRVAVGRMREALQ